MKTIIYSGGNLTVTDYTAGDIIKITSGSIGKTELGSNGTDVKFTVGSGSVLVKNGKSKVISLEDNRGSYTVSDTRIALGADFTGEMDAGKYLSTVTNIAGSGATTGVKLCGNVNANVMSGGAKADTMYGGEGDDKLYGYGGNDVLYGQQGNDYLYGGEGADKLYGGSGDDAIYGNAGNDVLDGYTGNDTLTGGAGNDTLSGGAGSDLFVYADGDGSDTVKDYTADEDTIKIAGGSISKAELGSNGTDVKFTIGSGSVLVKSGKGKVISLEDSRGSYTVSDTRIALGKDFTGEMDAGKYLSTVTNIAGSGATAAVTLRGNTNSNVMSGGAQADTLYGGDGADTLYGYGGNDVLYGQQGNDKLYGGAGADKLYGGSGDDAIYGNAGNDVLDGYTGNDTLTGGTGNDTLSGGADSDLFVYANGDGSDTVKDYTAGEDTIKIASGNISKTVLGSNGTDVKFTVGSGSITVQNGKGRVISLEDSRGSYTVSDIRIALGADFTGEMDAGKYLSTVTNIAGSSATAAVTLRGNTNSNVMSGGTQDDTMYGGEGDDKLYGYGGNDVFYGQQGDDSLYGGAGADKLYGGSGNDAIYGDAGNDVLDGYTGNDILSGGAGNDTLKGGDGDDTIIGGKGNDVLYGTADSNTFVYAVGDGNDKIMDFNNTLNWDVLEISGEGRVSETSLQNDGKDVVFTITQDGVDTTGTVTLKNVVNYAEEYPECYISVKDERGTVRFYTETTDYYTDINEDKEPLTGINLLRDFKGSIELTPYGETLRRTDGQNAGGALTITGTGRDDIIYGSSYDDTVSGGAGDDKLHGSLGDDKLYGSTGNDTLWGHWGTDTLEGGVGNDYLYGDVGDDFLYGQDGNDQLEGGDGDDALYGGADNDGLTGGAGDDTLYGGDGEDSLNGYSGNDTLYGGAGSDNYYCIGASNTIMDYEKHEQINVGFFELYKTSRATVAEGGGVFLYCRNTDNSNDVANQVIHIIGDTADLSNILFYSDKQGGVNVADFL